MSEKENKKEFAPFIGHRAVYPVGRSYAVSIPVEWFKAHGIDPKELKKLLLVADHDIRIVNPDHDAAVYDEVTKIARNIR